MKTNISKHKKTQLLSLVIGALGVTFGDIMTSPLYTLREAFLGLNRLALNEENVLGVLSMIFWSLIIIVSVKYIIFILRADNQGEGGNFALYTLIKKHNQVPARQKTVILTVLLIGAALLYGDGIITPAISIISAVEGLELVDAEIGQLVIPITLGILVGLFSIQRWGTHRVGNIFGPMIILWSVTLVLLGLPNIVSYPQILQAINPLWAIAFVKSHGVTSLVVMGAVVLCITGTEALYADLGHFGKSAIRRAWLYIAFPALVINYFGQGAILLNGQKIYHHNLFYSLAPEWALIPTIVIATMSTVIASQALISGAFSLTTQAIALNVFPRVKVVHTNAEIEGQIYVPFINWSLFIGCVLLVISFQESSNLAAAYGIAVTGTMLATTMAFYVVGKYIWHWPGLIMITLCLLFGSMELAFLAANLPKFWHGGYVPIVVTLLVYAVMFSWRWGRNYIATRYQQIPTMSLGEFIQHKQSVLTGQNSEEEISKRTAVVMTSIPVTELTDKIPPTIQVLYDKWGMLLENIIFLTIKYHRQPYFTGVDRIEVKILSDNREVGKIISVVLNYGYMQTPNIPQELLALKADDYLDINDDIKTWNVLVGREDILLNGQSWLEKQLIKLFSLINNNTKPASDYFGLGEIPQLTTQTINL